MPSTTSTDQVTTKMVVLATSSDWAPWFSAVKDIAKEGDGTAWNHIDPDSTTPSKLPEDLPSPEFKEVNPEATTVIDLTDEQFKRWQFLCDQQEKKNNKARTTKKTIDKVAKFIRETVALNNYRFVDHCDTVQEKLRGLKQHLAPSDEARQQDVMDKYRSLRKIRTESVDTFLDRYEKAYVEAIKEKIPDVENEDHARNHFLHAIRDIDTPYSTSEQRNLKLMERTGQTGKPTIHTMIEEFRHHRRYNYTDDKATTQAAFSTFKGQPQEKDQKNTYSPCLCGELHRYAKCPYLVRQNRPQGWVADENIQKSIKQRLSNDAYLRDIIERARQYANQNAGKPHANRSTDKRAKSTPETNAESVVALAASLADYKLRNHWTYDCATDVHICNSTEGFTRTRSARPGEVVLTGTDTAHPVEAFGTVDIPVDSPRGPITLRLLDVAYIPGYLTNLICAGILRKKGVYLDMENDLLYQKPNNILCYLRSIDNHWILTKRRTASTQQISALANSYQERSPIKADPAKLHRILGHPGQEVIDHLEANVDGISVAQGDSVPSTVQCESCALSKAKRVISRRSDVEYEATEPLSRVAFDLIHNIEAYNGNRYISHFRCFSTAMNFSYSHNTKDQSVEIIAQFIQLAYNRFNCKIKYIRLDGETSLGSRFNSLIQEHGISAERTAPYTPAQNGQAERSGGVIMTTARTMRIACSLPANLWPEITATASYLLNRTPTRKLKWKTPFEALTGHKPNLTHLHPIGCRAYPLRYNIPKLQKLEARAHIGYLVGYDSTNIYRVWVPSLRRIIRTRDVIFNDDVFYDPHDIDAGQLLQEHINQIEILQLPEDFRNEEEEETDQSETLNTTKIHREQMQSSQDQQKEQTQEDQQLLTPRPTPSRDQSTDTTPFSTPQASSPTEETSKPSTQNTAPKANQISSDFDTSNILEGRTRSRHQAHATALANTANLSGFNAAFAAGYSFQRKHQIFLQHLSFVDIKNKLTGDLTGADSHSEPPGGVCQTNAKTLN